MTNALRRSVLWAALILPLLLGGCSDPPGSNPVLSCESLGCASELRECVEAEGAPPRCGACIEEHVNEDSQCVTAIRCVDLNCIDEGRLCAPETRTAHASCGECRAGLIDEDGQCVPNSQAVCEPASDANSVLARCRDEEMRQCNDGDDGASCGACLAGYREPDGGQGPCVALVRCEDLSDCEGVCLDEPGNDAECVDNPCEDNQAYIPGRPISEACVTCNFDGLTGCGEGHFPRASGDDRCVCRTERGYFWNPNRSPTVGPELCDKDGDGWVDQRAAALYEDPNGDAVLRQAANCAWHVIDRFVLVNDMELTDRDENPIQGQTREISVAELTGGAQATIILQESVRNDDPAELIRAYDNGELGTFGGQRLTGADLNGLTRHCGDDLSDFNDDGEADLVEVQPPGIAPDVQAVFKKMSYFIELAYSRFEPGEAGQPGRYIITERSRRTELPLSYGDDAGQYWRQCVRFRDANFSRAAVSRKIGMDFAQYSAPPANYRVTDRTAWLGMGHSSQFKCISVVNTEPAVEDRGPHIVLLDRLRTEGAYTVNRCVYTGTEAAADSNPSKPTFDCTIVPAAAAETGVTWAAVNYRKGPYSDLGGDGNPPGLDYTYERGCADMCVVWRDEACSGASGNPMADPGKCFADGENFGRRYCGCGLTYGGPDCDHGCPSLGHVFRSPGYNPAIRDGSYWVCGGVVASSSQEFIETDDLEADPAQRRGYSVRGHVPLEARDDTPLCQDPDNCGETPQGYRVQ